MNNVSFTKMAHGTAEEYRFLDVLEKQYIEGLADRLLEKLRHTEHTLSGYQVSRLEHALQSATRALRNSEPDEMIVAALLHDIGDDLAPHSHSEYAAAVLRPYVSEKTYWIIKHHGLFQMYYYVHHLGGDRHARERHKNHRWYQDAIYFVENYDQNCFDPSYDSEPLVTFEPLLRSVFAQPKADDGEYYTRFGSEV